MEALINTRHRGKHRDLCPLLSTQTWWCPWCLRCANNWRCLRACVSRLCPAPCLLLADGFRSTCLPELLPAWEKCPHRQKRRARATRVSCACEHVRLVIGELHLPAPASKRRRGKQMIQLYAATWRGCPPDPACSLQQQNCQPTFSLSPEWCVCDREREEESENERENVS